MNRLCFVFLSLLSVSVSAAELTRVASSFEEKDAFGMFVDFTFDRLSDSAVLVRESYQGGELTDVTELNYQKYETKLGIDVSLGIYKDLELHIGVPIVFQQDREWTFVKGTDANNSTVFRNCILDPQGTVCGTPGAGQGRLFDVPANSYRGGLGDFTFGIAWNAFVQKKDPSKPNWTLRFDYTAPTANLLNPSKATSSTQRGAIGDKVHRYTFSTAVSRQLNRVIEPYYEMHYTLPWLGPGFYSNCDDASADRMGHPENCGQSVWNRTETGTRPAHTGGVLLGAEITVFEREDRHQRLSFDIRGFLNYTSESRAYNELSDLFGKLLTSSDFGQYGGQVGFVGQAADFIKLRASTSFAYNSERFLTSEGLGKDLSGNGTVDIDTDTLENNPNFDARIDRVGHRFRIQEQFLFRIQVTATFNF